MENILSLYVLIGVASLVNGNIIPERFIQLKSYLEQFSILVKLIIVRSAEELKHDLNKIDDRTIIFCTAYNTIEKDGNSRIVHSILEEAELEYIGSDSHTLKMVMSKIKLKKRWCEGGIRTPDFHVINDLKDIDGITRGYPYILKPALEGNSRGIDEKSIVINHLELEIVVSDRLPIYKTLILEQYLGFKTDLREFTVGLIGNVENPIIMPSEIKLISNHARRVITTFDKENQNAIAIPIQCEKLKVEVSEFASKAFKVSGVRDYARCDILHVDGDFYAIEINGQPMIPDNWFDRGASDEGFTDSNYIFAILLSSMRRNHNARYDVLFQKACQVLPVKVMEKITGFL